MTRARLRYGRRPYKVGLNEIGDSAVRRRLTLTVVVEVEEIRRDLIGGLGGWLVDECLGVGIQLGDVYCLKELNGGWCEGAVVGQSVVQFSGRRTYGACTEDIARTPCLLWGDGSLRWESGVGGAGWGRDGGGDARGIT